MSRPGLSLYRPSSALRLTISLLLGLAALPAAAGTDVLASGYDDARTGANLTETALDPLNVRPASFGRQFGIALDAPVFSQPLVATDVVLGPGDRRELVYVATGANSVYAFDANAVSAPPVWRRALVELPGGHAARVRGILSTPVIDRTTNALYVVTSFMEGRDVRFVLHALDLATGADRVAGPVPIRGAVDVAGTRIPFESGEQRMAVQRAALAVARNHVIVAFGGDFFEGWVFAFDKRDLAAKPAAFCTTCTSRVPALSGVDYLDGKCTFLGPAGGIWQAGRAPAVDADGQVYFFTGNKAHVIREGCRIPPAMNACSACTEPGGCVCEGVGSPRVCRGPDTCVANRTVDGRLFDVNDALIRLDPARGLALTGWFRPRNWNIAGPEGLEFNDLDLGSSGPVLLPGGTGLIGAGKQGVMYVLDTRGPAGLCEANPDRTCLGSPDGQPKQDFAIAPPPPPPNQYYRHVVGGPVLWPRAPGHGGSLAYVWRSHDVLRSYRVREDGRFEGCTRVGESPSGSWDCPAYAQSEDFIGHPPGGMLALSANRDASGSGIVWATTTEGATGRGRLMAFRAEPDPAGPGRLPKLWDSDGCAEDVIEGGSGFLPPTVANGRVYVATQNGTLEVFGPIPPRACEGAAPTAMPPTLRM
ncbi:MAG: hypothetical protein GC151_00935 [Betaproteobacteria bacterium]|nr:hypothetical protein [Betaproteobacteria bacterium]